MRFKEITNEGLTQFFLSDPDLLTLALPDDEIIHLYEHKEFVCDTGSNFIEVVDNENNSIAVIRWEYFTQIAIVVHIYLKSIYQHRQQGDKLQEIYDLMYNHLITNTKIRKVIAFATSTSPQVIKAAERYGFVKEGSLKNAVVWRNKVVDLEIYGLILAEK